ncbi:TPA: entericidin A/B family lipoprotein [Mannheimia haemolytica]|nr:entericidin A/B family lipoprotein [Mannheimia haemolytica]
MKKLVLTILAAATFLTACNTVDGVGKDVEKAGDKTQQAAQ